MDRKRDIIDAWITIEQLAEGTIDTRNKRYLSFESLKDRDYKQLFEQFIEKQAKKLKDQKGYNTKTKEDKFGLVVFFDIFDFQEVIDILRKRYKISSAYEETRKTKKFTFALYFDKNLNFLREKLFFTISGYIRYKKELPEDFHKSERQLRDDLASRFENDDFNDCFNHIFKLYKVPQNQCRYAFLENLENDDVNLHSFYIDDLNNAKLLRTKNLEQYFGEYTGNKINLNSNKESVDFNGNIFEEILQPKNYPLGRFPSEPDHKLSFMQQIAVNIVLNENETMLSVNGPPGTGKTTLLRDVIAEHVVIQAKEICGLTRKELKKNLLCKTNKLIGMLPYRISDKNIVVASSNNGALKNVVNELPQLKEIANEFQDVIKEVDYFWKIANESTDNKKSNQKLDETDDVAEENWGVFSTEGGNLHNQRQLFKKLQSMDYVLKNNYVSNPMVYKEFESLYTELALERSQRQNYYETIKKFPELINEYHSLLEKYNREEKEKSEALKHAVENYTIQLTNLLGNSKSEIALFKKLEQKLEKVQQDFEKIKEEQQQLFTQKPRLLRLRKFLKNDHVHRYLEELDRKQKEEKKLSLEKIDYEIKLKQKMQMIENYQVEIRNVEKYQKELTTIFDKWQQNKINELDKLKKEIEQIRKWQKEADFEELDLSQPYEELQTSNPWFTKEFRIKQSKLFFKALEVRKQFLYENRESFSTAWRTFKSPDKNGSTENDLKKVQESWQWVNFAIPVISTTFASFRKMFTNIEEEGISNLFIDEAGQALPQASVGAIFRSKKILVVGDPSQIKPVLTVDPNVLNLIRKNYRVSEHFISSNASTQTIIDNIGKYGFKNSVQKWRGIPLWVHRRSKDPMFTIANELSYDGLMVHGNPPKEIQGKGRWIDITGTANDKFVQEQATYVKKEIKKIMDKEDNKTMDKEDDDKPMDKEDNKTKNKKEIYVITPFKNVAYKLERELNSINFVKRENGKAVNVGTVHTFQGKEAEIVFLVLGADNRSRGAAEWVVSEPNLINVAATRAKSEFYIVGDKKLYSQLGSEVATKTIELLEQYNEKRKPLL